MSNPTITAELVRSLFIYDPKTGVFINRINRGTRAKSGKKTGKIKPHGYVTLCIDGKEYYAHRIAWLYMTGQWPTKDIDHKDRSKTNNSWENLREATGTQNNANSSIRSNNTTGVKGVIYIASKNKYRAKIKHNYKWKHLGYFNTIQEAAAAYTTAAKLFFSGYASN